MDDGSLGMRWWAGRCHERKGGLAERDFVLFSQWNFLTSGFLV